MQHLKSVPFIIVTAELGEEVRIAAMQANASRFISKPAKDLICIDLGHKAIASEMPQPRIKIMGIENYSIVIHSEEHMVIKTPEADNWKIGDPLYGIPWHICPTVDRYDSVSVVTEHRVTDLWNVEARKRKITI